jgi:hypothetical protein
MCKGFDATPPGDPGRLGVTSLSWTPAMGMYAVTLRAKGTASNADLTRPWVN